MERIETPVAMIVFNRPEETRRVFAAVKKARPSRLFLIADGPRAGRPGEADRCEQVRKIVSAVDWDCAVESNFAEENLGCRRRVISGLDWLFSRVEKAIILEDDCLPSQSFFRFCSEMLDRYRDDHQIGFVSGFNVLQESFPFPYSYYFTRMTPIWGWATWARAWSAYDEQMRSWPEVRDAGLLRLLFPEERVVSYWSNVFDRMHGGAGPNTWDYQWTYTCWMRNWVNILPAKNLIRNIGFDGAATHTTVRDPVLMIPESELGFPLTHPPAITSWPEHEMKLQKQFFAPGLLNRIRRKVRVAYSRITSHDAA